MPYFQRRFSAVELGYVYMNLITYAWPKLYAGLIDLCKLQGSREICLVDNFRALHGIYMICKKYTNLKQGLLYYDAHSRTC